MRYNSKIAVLLILILITVVSVFLTNLTKNDNEQIKFDLVKKDNLKNETEYDVWCIFTKADERAVQIGKFGHLLSSMLRLSSVPITLHLIVDDRSRGIGGDVIDKVLNKTGKYMQVNYYSIEKVVGELEDIVSVMKPHFSPKAGSYYSDSLFYVSLGLHRIASKHMKRAVLLDVDLQFQDDIALLFDQFYSFTTSNLFGLAPELAPVYYHLLSTFRSHNYHRSLNIGLPCCARLPSNFPAQIHRPLHLNGSSNIAGKSDMMDAVSTPGRPGVNSGVVLLRLDRIRSSLLFQTVTTEDFVSSLTSKYFFKGHLGDQDFYSLLSWEIPSLVFTLDCGWNRQLCTWWKDHGYLHIHPIFSYCPNKTKIYHANCNSQFPLSNAHSN